MYSLEIYLCLYLFQFSLYGVFYTEIGVEPSTAVFDGYCVLSTDSDTTSNKDVVIDLQNDDVSNGNIKNMFDKIISDTSRPNLMRISVAKLLETGNLTFDQGCRPQLLNQALNIFYSFLRQSKRLADHEWTGRMLCAN